MIRAGSGERRSGGTGELAEGVTLLAASSKRELQIEDLVSYNQVLVFILPLSEKKRHFRS